MIVRIALGTSVLIVGTILIFFFSIPHANTPDEAGPNIPIDTPATPVVRILDVFKNGTRSITGSLQVPNSCTTVSAESVLESDSKGILVLLTVLKDDGICLQERMEAPFATSMVAEEGIPIRVLVNGIEATTNPQ